MSERERIVELTGPIFVGVDSSSSGDWYCEADYNRETGVWTVRDAYQLPRGDHLDTPNA